MPTVDPKEMNVSPFLRKIERIPDYLGYAHRCPGCGHDHVFWLVQNGRNRWTLDAPIDHSKPSFSPSMRVFAPAHDGVAEETLCHYFLKKGMLQFLKDSKHSLAGQTVPLPPLED